MTPNKGYSKKRAKTPYVLFLRSNYWKRVRKTVLQRDNYTCQHCESKKGLNAHHISYKHHGKEHMHLEDLITLCTKCHEKVHKILNKYKKSK